MNNTIQRYLVLLVLSITFTLNLFAQEAEEKSKTDYLLKDPGSKGIQLSTFYGEIAPSTGYATINNTVGKVFMTELGIQLNRKFNIGFYLARSPKTSVINVPSPTDPEYQNWIDAGVELDQLPTGATQSFAYFSHSGLNIAYMYKSEKVIFYRGGIRFGTGKLELTAEKQSIFNFFNTPIYETKVINLNPEIGVGVNLRSWWRFHADLGYHFVLSGSEVILNPEKFDGTTFKFGFAFGNFSK